MIFMLCFDADATEAAQLLVPISDGSQLYYHFAVICYMHIYY